jgi:hypothetical protein
MSAPTLRIAYWEHSKAKVIYEEWSDGSVRKIRRPKSVEKMDRLRRKYGAAWRAIRPVRFLAAWREAHG